MCQHGVLIQQQMGAQWGDPWPTFPQIDVAIAAPYYPPDSAFTPAQLVKAMTNRFITPEKHRRNTAHEIAAEVRARNPAMQVKRLDQP